jgi:hypothetical protein
MCTCARPDDVHVYEYIGMQRADMHGRGSRCSDFVEQWMSDQTIADREDLGGDALDDCAKGRAVVDLLAEQVHPRMSCVCLCSCVDTLV